MKKIKHCTMSLSSDETAQNPVGFSLRAQTTLDQQVFKGLSKTCSLTSQQWLRTKLYMYVKVSLFCQVLGDWK